MSGISNQQIYDLLLDISREVAELDTSIDEVLVDMRALNRDISLTVRRSTEVSQDRSRDFYR
jgi:hypothetical protein